MPNPVAIGETAPQTALPAQVDIYDFDKTLVPFDSGSMVPVQRAAKGFWEKHLHQVYPWFTQKKRPAVIISASPDFLLEELQRRLGLPYLLCTRHNPKTGRILGQNCRGEEKVRRFHRAFPGVQVVDVYSDSLGHDKPIFGLATGTCYHVTGHAPHAFNYRTQYKD